MNRTIMLTGIILGMTAIIFGAFAAHSLRELIPSESLESFETGVRYQMYHALLLVLLSSREKEFGFPLKAVYQLIVAGLICFSFSIYILSLKELTGWNTGYFGLITPFGGVLLILGWALLGYRVFKQFN